MEFLIVAVVCFIFFLWGGVSGWQARERYAKKVIEQHIKKIEKNIIEDVKSSLITITIEQHNGTFFVYNKEDKTFMAQGKNKQELEAALSSRFPGKKFAASQEELEKAGLLS
jgi:hypothetical protein